MTASVQDTRLKRRFELWDSNGDGTIDRTDYETEARRILKAFGEQETSPKGRALLSAYLGMWDKLASQAKVGAQGKVTLEQFTDVSEREIVEGGDAGFDRNLRPTIEAIVNMCDTDGDGEVNPAEFKRWMRAVGVDERQADSAFRQIDSNGNGQLTVEELVTAVRDYHQGVNDVPLLGR
ncbi:EF-hand domain-containing protein [Actinokineospora xionganensis]|uniref:EF-hand domain-containing protein n=1 Tax=Actinokineospora xionganensis TaxID=2684470 RepID=A0ABR7LFM4_9PSEU|nr:EF-hand domain-containing protein [Actinokineospora xionganensis]MBC6451514.1 EF-hand domain-containing protein [Actinokineospora xionganensis]